MKHRIDLGLALSLLTIFALLLLAVAAGWIAPHDPENAQPQLRLMDPCGEYPLGTDHLGRCIFSRILFGIRISLFIGLSIVLFSALIGTILGSAAGYYSGFLDEAVMRVVDAFLSFPSIFLELSWAWRSATHSGVGIDDERRPALSQIPPVDDDLSGNCHNRHGFSFPFVRRRDKRHAGLSIRAEGAVIILALK
ncbi:MAG: hypothetical protein WBN94_10040 [Methanothrix sp.]